MLQGRPDHDCRYTIDPAKLQIEPGWMQTRTDLAEGLKQAIDWYVASEAWAPGEGCDRGPLQGSGLVGKGDCMIGFNDLEREYLTLEEVHGELVKLLLRFDAFCAEHGLRYSLSFGTLLGAVRHKGFIPWDDDLDVDMPRPDYDRLMELEGELPAGLHLVNALNGDFAYAFCKICTDEVRAQEPAYEGVMDEMLWIDIFPMDGLSADEAAAKKAKGRIMRATMRNVWATVNHQSEPVARRLIKTVGGAIFRLGNPRRRMLEAVSEATADPGYGAAERITCLVDTEEGLWSIPKDGYERTVQMEFEGGLFPCMGCWDEYLHKCYGDYMQLPPEDQRRTHCIKAWRV